MLLKHGKYYIHKKWINIYNKFKTNKTPALIYNTKNILCNIFPCFNNVLLFKNILCNNML